MCRLTVSSQRKNGPCAQGTSGWPRTRGNIGKGLGHYVVMKIPVGNHVVHCGVRGKWKVVSAERSSSAGDS